MKKIIILLAVMVFVTLAKAQDSRKECTKRYNLFKGDFQSKKYDDAYTNWIYLMDNCKKLSVSIYQYGSTLSEDIKKDFNLAKRVYKQRLEYFPKANPAKVHSDFATYLAKNKLATDDEIFAILEKAYKIDPTKMGVKNIYKYFQGVIDRNKDSNPQKVFDTYDEVLESVNLKLEAYAIKLKKLTKDSTRVLSKKEKRKVRAYKINSKALGTVESSLDAIILGIASCDRLIPLYKRDFEANKTNKVWLKRAVSRMLKKGCKSDPLYEKLSRAYAEADPSPDAYSFLASVLEDKGEIANANKMRQKSFDLETDPIKKARFKLRFAQEYLSKGQLIKARKLAREAINFNRNFGKAYLFIGRLYQTSVNKCGKSEFEKRMIYVAALDEAKKAIAVDPSIAVLASKYIKSYKSNIPNKKLIFTAGVDPGSSYKIRCWINKTVKVPLN